MSDDEFQELLDSIENQDARDRLMERLGSEPDDSQGMLDRTARAYLLADEMGLYTPEKKDIGKMRTGETIDVEGEIIRIDPVKHFTRRDGGEGSLISLHIDDGTGRCRLTIFDWKLIERVEGGEFQEGNRVRVIGVMPQDRGYGLELKFSKGSQLVNLDGGGEEEDGDDGKGETIEIEGVVVSISEPYAMHIRGESRWVIKLMVFDGERPVSVLVPKEMKNVTDGLDMEQKIHIEGLKRLSGGELIGASEGLRMRKSTD